MKLNELKRTVQVELRKLKTKNYIREQIRQQLAGIKPLYTLDEQASQCPPGMVCGCTNPNAHNYYQGVNPITAGCDGQGGTACCVFESWDCNNGQCEGVSGPGGQYPGPYASSNCEASCTATPNVTPNLQHASPQPSPSHVQQRRGREDWDDMGTADR